jgi:hypothetical protein
LTQSGTVLASGSALPARRDYKDTIFRRLFQDRENLLSLYNAVNRTSYTDAEALTVVTLENAVYMNMKNDVAFLLDNRLSLYEHQSTWNPNMPLRDLFYVSRTYQGLVKDETLYSSKRLRLPAPHFLVFYNGTEEREESSVLKLSDSFEYVGIQKEEPNLELKVLVLNINQGKNKELLEVCKTLKEYMIFVDRIRLYTKTMELGAAAERAVDECIHEGVLSDFLRKNRGEAIEMSIFEYDEERELKLIRRAEYEEGLKEGREEGREDGLKSHLRSQVVKKLKKGKTAEQIAEELEEKVQEIEQVIRELQKGC